MDPIGFVVRDVTGETQLSTRFTLRSHAQDFAQKCAMPVRVWRVIRKTKLTRVESGGDHCPHGGAPGACPVLGCANQ